MKMKKDSSYASAPWAIYSFTFIRRGLHSRLVSRLISMLPPRTGGRLVGRLLAPYVKPGCLNVLAVNRELLSKDTEQIARRTGINFIPWRSGHLGRLIAPWTPKVCQIQTACIMDEQHRNHPCWIKGQELLAGLFETLQKNGSVPAAISANIDYWQEEPLRRFCGKSGIKHLVLDRENHCVEEYRANFRREYARTGFTFNGHAAVFSEHMKQLLIESNACSAGQITVTGAPRMDVWLDQRPVQPKDTVTCLSFRTCLIPEMFDDAINIFIDAARRNPDLQFVVKCKEGRGDYGLMQEKFKACNAPANLRPEQHINMRDLLDRSKVIVGFNTLSLAEALLTDTALIIPSWLVTSDNKHLTMMDPDDAELGKEIQFPRTLEQFRQQLDTAIQTVPAVDRALRLKLTNRYMLFTPGESASQRVAALLARLTESKS
jgi:hypothetical protein